MVRRSSAQVDAQASGASESEDLAGDDGRLLGELRQWKAQAGQNTVEAKARREFEYKLTNAMSVDLYEDTEQELEPLAHVRPPALYDVLVQAFDDGRAFHTEPPPPLESEACDTRKPAHDDSHSCRP